MPRSSSLRKGRLALAALIASAGMATSVLAQGEPAATPVEAVAKPAREPGKIRFNFKDAPLDQVVDFFARESGLPVIFETKVPEGGLTFIGAGAYTFEEALTILNLNLMMRGVQLRRSDQFLYLATLQDSAKRATEVANERVPDDLRPDQMLTLTIPLQNAIADKVAEQIKGLIGPYGQVVAVPTQNLVILLETAAQCRRIQEIVAAIDAVKPADAAIKLFPLKHAQAPDVLNALRALMGERRRTVFVEKDNQQRVVEDLAVTGVQLTADPRTNAIIAVGPVARLRTVEELIALLDVPEGVAGGGAAQMMTFVLTVAVDAAAQRLNALFAPLPPAQKPVVVPLPEAGKITVVGTRPQLTQASALIGEIDPGAAPAEGGTARPESRATVITLRHISAATVDQIVGRLLTPRQAQVLRYAAAPDGRSIVVRGPDEDVAAMEQLLKGLDTTTHTDREVRVTRIADADPRAVLARAERLYEAAGLTERMPVSAAVEGDSKTVTLIGTREGVAKFEQMLTTAQGLARPEPVMRSFQLAKARPSAVAPKAARLARAMLTTGEGVYVEPAFEPVDELGALIVRALPEQFSVVESLLGQLDAEDPASREFRVVRFPGADLRALIDRVAPLYEARTRGLAEDLAGPVRAEIDELSGSLILHGNAPGLRIYTELLNQARQLVPPARTTRVVDCNNVQARTLLEPLTALLRGADPIDPSRAVPEPTITVLERTNSLVVTAEEAQHQLVADFIRRLDRIEQTDLPPMKLLQLRTANAAEIAGMLTQQYGQRPQAERAARPVDVRADVATNTLIVSAHPDLFDSIRTFVDELNKEKKAGRETRIFPLKVARAADVAAAMERLYPLPPMPVDRLGRPMPWAQQPKEVTVAAEPQSNALIIDADVERMESLTQLVEMLDRVELPPAAELRTYRVVGANLGAIASTLQGLARQGNMSAQATPGKPQVPVLIEQEPRSSTLIVAGDAVTFERVEKMLKDLSAIPIEKGLRIVPITNVAASAVRAQALAIYNAQVAQIPGANPVEITVDDSTNSLMVVADGEAMVRISAILEELARQAGPAREVRYFELKLAKAAEVGAFLRDLSNASGALRIRGGPELVIEELESTNSLLVAASPIQLAIVEQLVRNMDVARNEALPPLRILRVKTSDAANLAQVLERTYEQRPQEQRAKFPVRIEADGATNTLIVAAHQSVLPEIEAIVEELNETQASDAQGREIRIFPLKVARAEELARTIDQMYPEPPTPLDPRTRQPRPDLRQPKEITVRADAATNSLIVDAPSKRLQGFEQLVKSLDQQKIVGDVEVRTYRVRQADLNAVAASLRSMAAGGAIGHTGAGGKVVVDTEPGTRTLIVTGPAEVFGHVEKVLAEVDAVPDRPATALRMYPLRNARATKLQPLVQRVLAGRLREELAGQGRLAELETLLEVGADTASNTLIVSAPAAVLEVATALVQTLDQEAVESAVEVRVFRLARGEAASVATALRAGLLADPRTDDVQPTVTPEPASNTIVVVGTPQQIERAARLVEQMDVAVEPAGLGVRTLYLRHNRAESLAPVLQSVLARESPLDRLPDWARATAIRQRPDNRPEPPSVKVAAEPRLNAIIVSGPLAVMDLAEQVVKELDVDPGAQGGEVRRPVRVITLRNADAVQLASNIEAVFMDDRSGEAPPTVRVDAASNSLIVRASLEQMAGIEDLATKLDSATLATSRQMRMIPVDRSKADADLMARTLKRLLEQQGGVKVNVISTDELLKQREAPSERKDGRSLLIPPAPGIEGPSPRGLLRPGGDGLTLALFAAAVGAVQPEEETDVTIGVDPASNALIVVGSPRMTERIRALAAELEQQMPAEPSQVHVVTLPANVEAQPLSQLLMQTINQIGRRSPVNTGGFTGPVSAMADPTGGAMIIVANETDFATVGQLIASVSQLGAAAQLTVKVYPLATITAQRAMAAIVDLVSPAPRGAQARRLRSIDFTFPDGTVAVTGKIDPALVRVVADPSGGSIIIAAPAEAIPVMDQFIAMLDQSPAMNRPSIRRYELRNARARDLGPTMQQLFEAQRQGAPELPQARFIPDDRTNSLLVTASETQHTELRRLLDAADAGVEDRTLELAILRLQQATPSAVARVVEQVIVGRDPGKRDRVQISADDATSAFVVRAEKEVVEEIRELVSRLDTAEAAGLPVRAIKLQKADAQVLATTLQRFFTDRAQVSSRPGMRVSNRVAVLGDRRSATLMVAANDEDFAQIEAMVATFDAPSIAADLQFKIIPLQNARVNDIAPTLQNILWELQYERMWGGPGRGGFGSEQRPDERLFLDSNERLNSIVLVGQGSLVESIERVIATLDAASNERTQLTIRTLTLEKADPNTVKNVVERALATPGWRPWRGTDPDAVVVEVDRARRTLIFVGKGERVEQAMHYARELDAAGRTTGLIVEAVTLEHARADRAANSLRQFFSQRARALGMDEGAVSIIGSQDGNVLVIAADERSMEELRGLINQIDQPELGSDRKVQLYLLKNSPPADMATAVKAMFPGEVGRGGRVVAVPQPSINAVVISAPESIFEQVDAVVRQLDEPPTDLAAKIVTVPLNAARATDVATALRAALPASVKVTITPIARSNALMLTGSDEAIAVVVEQVRKIDTEPLKSLVVFRRFKLKNAMADDVSWTLTQMMRARPAGPNEPPTTVDYLNADNTLMVSAPADAMAEIERMVAELDVPAAAERRTDFVKLEFAKAEQVSKALEMFYGRFAREARTPGARNVTIVPDPASNSLVISADENEWAGLRSFLAKLDRAEYDTSRQLEVIPLVNADATSVARALNEGFRIPIENQIRREQARTQRTQRPPGARDEEPLPPTLLVDAEGVPFVSAEPQTNSLIVSASRRDLERIRDIIAQLDVAEFARLEAPRVIPLKAGRPSAVAANIRELYLNQRQGTQARPGGPRSVVIIGDDTSGALIVRADDEQFEQIRTIAATLESQGEAGRALPTVIRLRSVAAGRLRETLVRTFTPVAQQMGEPLSIELDRSSNALIVAASPRLLGEIRKVVEELDTPAIDERSPDAVGNRLGQSLVIVDVVNNAPEQIRAQLEAMGLTRPQPADRPGLVSEPVTIVPMTSRRAVAVLVSPGDGPVVTDLIRVLDAQPVEPDQQSAVVALRMASATAVVNTLRQLLSPAEQAAQTGPARALAEQVRRLGMLRTGVDQSELKLDVSKPIRLIPDTDSNSVIVASTPANVAALREVIRMLDTLPVGDAVVVRIFPLSNASANRVQAIVKQLFEQGEALRRLPGTQRRGLPTSTTGQALAGEIAAAVDDRTNTLIVAGREEAVALVEVLVKDLDSDAVSNWIEPVIIPLEFADAVDMAAKLRQVLVQGLSTTPEAMGLQRVYGRLRVTQTSRDGARPGRIEGDLFAPVTGLVIVADAQLNSLIVVGTPGNIAIVRELVTTLDVEKAAAANEVRLFPLRYAAADRVANVVRDVFAQRQRAGAMRQEDQLVVTPDMRTNSLVVSTSPRSFAILESLLRALDGEKTNYAVGLHVIPVTDVDVRVLAPRIERLMRERLQAAARVGDISSPADAFSIEAEPTSNLLIVACSEENLTLVKEFIATLTADAARFAAAERQELFQLRKTPAQEAVQTLRQLYVDRENSRRGGNAVSLSANDRLNSILVSGTEQDISEVRRLIERIDGAEVHNVRVVERIELRSSNALEVVSVIENVLGGRPVSGTSGIGARQATRIQFVRQALATELEREGRRPTEADIDGIIKDQVTLTPDLRSNSILLNAPPQVVKLLKELIEDLDSTAAGARKIEIFRLKNADARQMATLLQRVFRLEQQGNALVLVPARPREVEIEPGAFAPVSDSGGPTVTAVPDPRQQLSIAIDTRTNTLIVSGTAEYMALVKQLVDELDGIQALERQQEVFHLRNALAKEVEATLRSYFQGERDLRRNTLPADQAGALARILEEEVTIVGDEKSNKIVISTSPRYMETVMDLVRELDSAPPQVLIQVLVAEVTLDNSDEWGMDIKAGPFFGRDFRFGSLASGSGVQTALGVPNLSVSSQDFSLLIRALEAQGKLEVLSEPQLLVNNNTKAQIQVGSNVALVENVEFTPQGSTRSSVSRKDVGIILDVTPNISSDGFVRMEIKPEISTVSARTTAISSEFQAPIIDKRTVDTTVTVKDGQSVVIGGLIQSTDERRKTKVPILGDIPIFGIPFRSEKNTVTKTELLVILTPRVVLGRDQSSLERSREMTDRAVDRLSSPETIRDRMEKASQPLTSELEPPPGGKEPRRALPETPAPLPERRRLPSDVDPITPY